MRQHVNGDLNDKDPDLQRSIEQARLREQLMERTPGGEEPRKEKGRCDPSITFQQKYNMSHMRNFKFPSIFID